MAMADRALRSSDPRQEHPAGAGGRGRDMPEALGSSWILLSMNMILLGDFFLLSFYFLLLFCFAFSAGEGKVFTYARQALYHQATPQPLDTFCNKENSQHINSLGSLLVK